MEFNAFAAEIIEVRLADRVSDMRARWANTTSVAYLAAAAAKAAEIVNAVFISTAPR